MKKTILALFVLIPLVASCNKTDKGFVDPFPDDDYNPIGFNIADDEKISRPLSSEESALIDKTIEGQDTFYKQIVQENIDIHERDYTRAFAGEFAQGYSVSNKKIDSKIVTFYQPQSLNPTPLSKRRESFENKTTLFDFSYGRNTTIDKTKTIRYYAEKIEGEAKIILCKEAAESNKYNYVLDQNFYNDEYISGNTFYVNGPEITPTTDWAEKDFIISQSNFIFRTSETTSAPGAKANGEIVLIKVDHKKYGDDGVFTLEDGRQYRAMVNSIIVTRLKKPIPISSMNIGEDEWYLVNQSRLYNETVITSDVIQPNVPISYLKNPIVINYREEIHNFKTVKDEELVSDGTIEEDYVEVPQL